MKNLWRLYSKLPLALIVLIGVCYAVISSGLSYLGDDLSYYVRSLPYAGTKFYLFPKLIAATWMGANGRLQNVIAPALFQYVPSVMVWVLNGAITALLFFMVIKWCRGASTFSKITIIAVLAFGLPWWDMFLLFVVNIGYTWGMAIILVFLWYFFKDSAQKASAPRKWLLAVLGFLAGGMHEGSSVPLCVALAVYLFFSGQYRALSPARRYMLAGLIVGVLYCTLSPAIWMRVGGESTSDGPWWGLLGSSSYIVLLLALALIAAVIWRRDVLKQLLPTPWSVFVMMALMSLPIVVVGGIVGRSGFFGQVSAIIAMYMLAARIWPRRDAATKTSVALAVLLSVAVAVHYIEFVRYQTRLNTEVHEALAQYRSSVDGAVYLDYTSDPDMPWYLLRKTRGVPDEDDFYLCTNLTQYAGAHSRPFTVLPTAVCSLDLDTISLRVMLPKGYLTTEPCGREMPRSGGRRLISTPGRPDSVAVPVPSSSVFYVTERDFDPSGSY